MDFIDLNVPGLLQRYVNPSHEWQSKVCAWATTQLAVFRQHALIKEAAPALHGPVTAAVVRFSDYTEVGQAFVKTGALDKWLASCDRKGTTSAYLDPMPLERRIKSFLAKHASHADPDAMAEGP